MEAAAVKLYFLLEHNYSLVTMSCILHIIWVNSKETKLISAKTIIIARGLCTLVPFIISGFKECNHLQTAGLTLWARGLLFDFVYNYIQYFSQIRMRCIYFGLMVCACGLKV